ncbi:MAG: hypothetical protein ACRCU2_08615, partial [Planktothrix sp.]
MNQQQRYQAIQVKGWEQLRENGYGFFVIEKEEDEALSPKKKYRSSFQHFLADYSAKHNLQRPSDELGKEVWFHINNLPPQIRHWFTRDYPREPLLPKVSFTIAKTDKGEVAENIRLEPHFNREVIWRNNGKLLSLQLGLNVKIKSWPDDDLSVWEPSDFWICEVFPILPGCESGDGYIARICQKFVLGEDKIVEAISPYIAILLNRYLGIKIKNMIPQVLNLKSLDDLCNRIDELQYSFGIRLSYLEKSMVIDRLITKNNLDIFTDESVNRLAPYLPGLLANIWEKKIKNLPWIALDLESDRNTIWEFALVEKQRKISHFKNPSDQQLKKELTKIKPGQILVGHNIEKWDLPILEKTGCAVNQFEVIDTLLEEMQLNPLRLSYALDTAHTALKDAYKTLALAHNQYLRKHGTAAVQEKANKEADTFFLNFPMPPWRKVIEPLLDRPAKTLIIGPEEYADFLMLPPVAQVIQPTAKPRNFKGN